MSTYLHKPQWEYEGRSIVGNWSLVCCFSLPEDRRFPLQANEDYSSLTRESAFGDECVSEIENGNENGMEWRLCAVVLRSVNAGW